MKKIPFTLACALVIISTQAAALNLGSLVKSKPSSASTTPSNGTVIDNSDPAAKLFKQFKDFLKSKFQYNTFYDCYQSPYAEMLKASEDKYGKATIKDAFTAQWLFKVSERNGRASCLQIDLVDELGQHSSGAQGVAAHNTTGWCDFLSERNKLPIKE